MRQLPCGRSRLSAEDPFNKITWNKVVGPFAWALSSWNATGQERRETFRVIANSFLPCLRMSQRTVSQPVLLPGASSVFYSNP